MEATKDFVLGHPAQILITAGLVGYSLKKDKLTPGGIAAAVATAGIHMAHPEPLYFYLLVTFFGLGTIATKVHHIEKATLTQSSTGGIGGEGPRNASQVLANSATASMLILLHLFVLSPSSKNYNLPVSRDILLARLPLGIIANYAATTADTLSSELGILSTSSPFLITAPWRRVPRGTNGGITLAGLYWGFAGSSVIGLASSFALGTLDIASFRAGFTAYLVGVGGLSLFYYAVSSKPRRPDPAPQRTSKAAAFGTVAVHAAVCGILRMLSYSPSPNGSGARHMPFGLGVAMAGLAGSVLDSVLGAVCQATVEDVATKRVIEGANGKRVPVIEGGSRVRRGTDLLNNNGVNFVMAAVVAVGGMGLLPLP